MKRAISLLVNEQEYAVAVDDGDTLLDTLRDRLRLTGTKKGCNVGDCGACTVLVDGQRMTRSGIAQRLRLAAQRAAEHRPALRQRRISPHTLRHTTAMHLLQSGVDLSVIAMWLGHESIQTTHQYLVADLETKKRALACLQTPNVRRTHVPAADSLLQFLARL